MTEPQELTYSDVVRFFAKGLKFALAAALVAGLGAYFVSRLVSPRYEATARLLLAPPNQALRDLIGLTAAASPLDSSAYRQAATTETVLLGALRLADDASPTLDDAAELRLRTKVTSEDDRNSSLIVIRVRSHDASRANEEVNAIANSLLAWDLGRAVTLRDRTVVLLGEQIDSLSTEIAELASDPGVSRAAIAEVEALRDSRRDQLLLIRSGLRGGLGSLEMFQEAVGPAEQVVPRPTLYAVLAAIAGLIAAYSVLMVSSAAGTRVHSLEELERIAGVPVLAALGRRALNGKNAKSERSIAFLSARLAVSLHQLPMKLLTVGVDETTDSRPVSILLAKSFAERGNHALFIGTDQRKRPENARDELPQAVLDKRGSTLEQHLSATDTAYDPTTAKFGNTSLDVILRSKSGGSETVSLARGFAPFIRRMQLKYDVIVVDAAPLTVLPDALAIGPNMTGILLVVRFRRLKPETVTRALASLGPLKSTVVGIVVTDLPGGVDSAGVHGAQPLAIGNREGRDVGTRTSSAG